MKSSIIAILFLMGVNAFSQSSITWGNANDVSANTFGNLRPRISVDNQGNPMVIWGKTADQSVYFSRWTGSGFNTPIKLNPSWMSIATASWMGPDIASKGDTVYVVAKRIPEDFDTNHIFIFTSFNGGNSFMPPVQVDNIGDSISRFPTVTTDIMGNPLVAFMKFNSTFGDSRWVMTKSSDFGNTFSTDKKASGWNGTNDEVCDCCPGAVVSSGNTTAVLYRDNFNNIRDIWAGLSMDNGNSFMNGMNVDNHNWMIMSCPSTGPDGIIIADTLYSVFMSAGAGSTRCYLSKASLSTSSVSNVSMLGSNITGLSQQNYPRIANFGAVTAIVWKQMVNGVSQLPISFTQDIANGFPAVYDTVDISNVTNADVAINKNQVIVVWQDDNSGTVKYRIGNYQGNTIINESISNHFEIFPNPVQQELNIVTETNELYSYRIYNSMGELIHAGQSGSNHKIQTSNLLIGIYYLQILSNQKSFTQKFIKQ